MGNILAPSGASLYDAIAEGDADAAVEVLQAHPDLTRKRLGTKKRTLYHFCAASGQVSVLKSLCDHVWRTVPDESGVLAGVQGCYTRQHPAIRQYINRCDQKGLTPLSLACKKGHAHVVTFLLTQGADPWVKDRMMGRTALHHAARANHPDCIETILSSNMVQQTSGPDTSPSKLVDHPTNSGYTPLHYAVAAHSREAAAVLLRHGANPNAKTWEMGFEHLQLDRGSTPMHAAGRYQSLDVAMLLLRHWDENLRRLDVTDPRVVENLPRIKPYQMPGVKLNKTLFRVLDPATPLREIRGYQSTIRGNAPLSANQRIRTGLQRQESELSGSGSGGAEESGPGESYGPDNPLPERSSPPASVPRQAISVTARPGPTAAFKEAPLEAGNSSRDSNGAPENVTAADRSCRRSFADANSPTSPVFSPKASSSPFSGALAPLGSEIPQDRSLDPSRSTKRLALPIPVILNSHHGAANPGVGPMGRSRSGAVFPMPTPPGGPSPSPSPSAGPVLLRTRSLHTPLGVQASPSAGTATSPNPLAPEPGSDCRADGRQPRDDQHILTPQAHLGSWVSCATSMGKGALQGLSPNPPASSAPGRSSVAYPGQMPLAAAAASLGFSQDELDCAPFQPVGRQPQPPPQQQQQQQQGATLNARPQSVRDGNAYNNANALLGRGADSLTSAACPTTTAWQDSQIASSAPASGQQLGAAAGRELQKTSSGGRSLARTLSRKLSSLAAAATGTVRQDSVRVCNSERLQSGGGTAGSTDSISLSGSAAVPLKTVSGWTRPAALGCTTAGGAGGVGPVPPPSVRRAF
ncbi:hypothetical protein Vafri_5748 [Volvox africanus]|nr:hypothetical protein Vafri_5748 [Volvox africanus]